MHRQNRQAERKACVFSFCRFDPFVSGGCLYNTPSGGAEDAVLWPGHDWNSDEVELLLDEGEEAFNMESLPEL